MSGLSFKHALLTASCLLALAGCEVGPDYEAPKNDLPNNWVSDENNAAAAKAEVDQEWWKNFNDPTLTQLIEKANAGNFDLKIAEARIAEARAQVSSSELALLPTGDVKGTATREANQLAFPDAGATGLGPLLKKPFNIFQTGFDASWELDLFGGSRRAEEQAEEQMQASEASRDDARVSLMAEVARTYVAIRATQSQLAVTQDIIAADQKTLDIAQQRFTAGEAPRLDAVQADATMKQALTRIPDLHNELAQNEYAMDVLLGEQPGATQKIITTAGPVPVSSAQVVLIAPAATIAQRPDIRVAERKLAASTAQQGVAVAQFFPKISLTGFFGVLNTSVNGLISPANQSWVGGASVVWPILNYGTLSANLDSANAQQQEAMATYRKTVISALSDVERSLTAYNEQQKFLQATADEIAQDKHALDVAQERYKSGLTSILDVLEAKRMLDEAQTRLVTAQATVSQNLIALYKSLGGGWNKNS